MTKVRFLIDDVNQCQTQRAVLQVFATDLQNKSLGDVVWASETPNLSTWENVPKESSRQLALRLFALTPASEQLTIFFPGHIVPGILNTPLNIEHTIAANSFTTVQSLDLFIVNNTSPDLSEFHTFKQTNSDYDILSSFELFSTSELPNGFTSGGLKSCLRFTDRPWYSVFSPLREKWLVWVQKALSQGNLTISMIQEDIHNGLVRPSLLDDVIKIIKNQELTSFSSSTSTLDSLFIYPECRLSDAEYQLLHSQYLQARTIEFSNRQSKIKKKGAKQLVKKQHKYQHIFLFKNSRNLYKPLRSLFKKTWKLTFLTAYKIYSISLRPVIKQLLKSR